MALTVAREFALFQILEVPYTNKNYKIINDNLEGNTSATNYYAELNDSTGSSRAAKTAIQAFLTSDIYPTADLVTVLEGLLDDWIALGTDTTSIDAGAVGNIQGVTINASLDREEIRKQVLIAVPFYRFHEEIERRKSGNITLIR